MEKNPPQAVCVVSQQFCAPHQTELTVQRKPFSGGDFAVSDSNGNLVFKVTGKVLSLTYGRYLQDAAGNRLLTMREKRLSMHERWQAFRGKNSDERSFLFTTKKSSVIQFRKVLHVFLAANKDEKIPDFHVKCNYFDSSCTVYQGHRIIAEMRKKSTVSNVLLGKDTFIVIIQPAVDYAFITALIAILYEMNRVKTT